MKIKIVILLLLGLQILTIVFYVIVRNELQKRDHQISYLDQRLKYYRDLYDETCREMEKADQRGNQAANDAIEQRLYELKLQQTESTRQITDEIQQQRLLHELAPHW